MTTTPRLIDQTGIRFGLAHAVLISVLLVSALCHLGGAVTGSLVVLSMGIVSAGLPWQLRPVVAVVAWAFVTGFVANTSGQLTFTAGDDRRLVAFVIGVVLVAGGCRLVPRSPG